MTTNEINLPMEFEKILNTVPASQLKKSLSEILTRCVLGMENDISTEKFSCLINDFYAVHELLEKAEKSGLYE
jgi:hypothetical protein